MRKERLIKNIIDQIKEVQMKLGYVWESIHLYFPWESLVVLMGKDSEVEGDVEVKSMKSWKTDLLKTLNTSPIFTEGNMGKLLFKESKGRVEVIIPPEGAKYVYKEVPDPPFLKAVIELFHTHHSISIEEISACFARFSSDYECRKIENNDFDYVLFFRDPEVDPYYYCIKMEMGHTIYHRFIKEDYKKLME